MENLGNFQFIWVNKFYLKILLFYSLFYSARNLNKYFITHNINKIKMIMPIFHTFSQGALRCHYILYKYTHFVRAHTAYIQEYKVSLFFIIN